MGGWGYFGVYPAFFFSFFHLSISILLSILHWPDTPDRRKKNSSLPSFHNPPNLHTFSIKYQWLVCLFIWLWEARYYSNFFLLGKYLVSWLKTHCSRIQITYQGVTSLSYEPRKKLFCSHNHLLVSSQPCTNIFLVTFPILWEKSLLDPWVPYKVLRLKSICNKLVILLYSLAMLGHWLEGIFFLF